MCKNGSITMLMKVLAMSLVFQSTGLIGVAKAGKLPSCYMEGEGGRVANVRLQVGDLCSGDGQVLKMVKSCKYSGKTRVFDFNRCLKRATKKDLEKEGMPQSPISILREACPKLERLAEEKGAALKSNGKDLKKSEAAEDLSECVVSRARLPNPDNYGEKSLACLELMAQSCFEELDRLNAEQNPDCVDCNMR
jgi:hypothetical protein